MGKDADYLNIKAFLGSLEDTVQIRDVFYYNSLTGDKKHYTTTEGSATVTYTENGLRVTGTVNTNTMVKNNELMLPNNYIAEMEIMDYSSTTYSSGIVFEDMFWTQYKPVDNKADLYILSTNSALNQLITPKMTKGSKLRFERNGNDKTMKVYYDNTLKKTISNINSTGSHYIRTYKDRTITVRNLIIHEL